MFDPVIAPSGTLLGLLQRGRGDGTLHALTAPRAEALAALNHCVLSDPRHDWQVENRSLYYARLYLDLHGELGEIERHLFDPDDVLNTDESRTGLALAVLGHLASYGRRDALELLRRYAAFGSSWAWALDELALRDDDAGLRVLAAPILDRFPEGAEGDAELAAAVRDAFEPRPWRLWADDPREAIGARVRAAQERGSFDQWQRQMRPSGPRPGWSVRAVFDWAQEGLERGAVLYVPAARCLTAVAGPGDRAEIVQAALTGHDGARSTALRYLADAHDPDVLDLIEAAVESPSHAVVDAALDAFERMRTVASLERARRWAPGPTPSAPPRDACSPAAAAPRTPNWSWPHCARRCAAKAPTHRHCGPWSTGPGASASPAPPPSCATSTERPPRPICAATPPRPWPPPTRPSPPDSPSNACGTARNRPVRSPRATRRRATRASWTSSGDSPPTRPRRPRCRPRCAAE